MGALSFTHILVLLVLGLLFFGGGTRKIPELGQSLGKAIRGFKQGLNEIDVDAKDIHDSPEQIRTTAQAQAAEKKS